MQHHRKSLVLFTLIYMFVATISHSFAERAPTENLASIFIVADNQYELFFNGKLIGKTSTDYTVISNRNIPRWTLGTHYRVAIKENTQNVFAVKGTNTGGPAGIKMVIQYKGKTYTSDTNKDWKLSRQFHTGWTQIDFDDSKWLQPTHISPSLWKKVGLSGYWEQTRNFPNEQNAKWLWSPKFYNGDKISYFRFVLDNRPLAKDIIIDGKDTIPISTTHEISYPYTASVRDNKGNPITSCSPVYSLKMPLKGVMVDSKSGLVTLSPDAIPGMSIFIIASYQGLTTEKEVMLIQEPIDPASIEITGPERIFVKAGEPVTVTYKAIPKDKAGNVLDNITPSFSYHSPSKGVILNPVPGSITVTTEALSGEKIIVFAAYKNISDSKKVSIFTSTNDTFENPDTFFPPEKEIPNPTTPPDPIPLPLPKDNINDTIDQPIPSPELDKYTIAPPKSPLGSIKYSKPYLSGYPDKTFRPSGAITRAEVASIFSKIMDLKKDPNSQSLPTDLLDNTWYYNAVCSVIESNIIKPYPDGTFKPDQPMTRAEVAEAYVNYCSFKGIKIETIPHYLTDITGNPSEYIIAQAVSTKLMTGFPDDTFKPSNTIQRDQMTATINKLIGRGVENYKNNTITFIDVKPTHWAFKDIEVASMFMND